SLTASAAPTMTRMAVPRPPPPWPWVWAPSGIPITILLVFGGGLPPVADLARGPVDGAGTAALDAAAALAPGADLHPPLAGLDGAGAAEFAAADNRARSPAMVRDLVYSGCLGKDTRRQSSKITI